MGMRFQRHGRWVYRDKRWPALRLMAKRRDGFRCVQCGSRHRLEVDHIEPVRSAPDRAFDIDNLQTLCGACHGGKTRLEAGHPPLSPQRQAWRDLVAGLRPNPSSMKGKTNA